MTWLWIAWIVAFFALEVPALLNKREGDTLSEHLWRWFSINEQGHFWRLRRFALLAILAWLAAHLLTRGVF